MYVECILLELGIRSTFHDWIRSIAVDDSSLETGLNTIFKCMKTKIDNNNAMFNLPVNGKKKNYGGTNRAMCPTHPKEMQMALTNAINTARQDPELVTTTRLSIQPGFFQRIVSFGSPTSNPPGVVRLLASRKHDDKVSNGEEADQRRDIVLYDHHWIELFRSILSCRVAEHQRSTLGKATRAVLDTATLGVILSMYKPMGKRGMTLDDLKHGYLGLDRFKSFEVWDTIKPFILTLKSAMKSDTVNSTKHLVEIMHHRDPMLCAFAMLGLYMCMQFLVLRDALPTVATWLTEDMFKRPLLRQLTGGAATVTAFNGVLKQELEFIDGADPGFTMHCLRDMRISDAGEDPSMRCDTIKSGAGHTTGSHEKSYRNRDASWLLSGAGYHGTDPEMLAAHSRVMYMVGGGPLLPPPSQRSHTHTHTHLWRSTSPMGRRMPL